MESLILEVAAQELLKAVTTTQKKSFNFKSTYKRLESTIMSLFPIVIKIDRMCKYDGVPNEVIQEFLLLLQNAEELVEQCSEVQWWNCPKKYWYSEKVLELDASLGRFCQLNLQVEIWAMIMKMMMEIREINVKLDRINTYGRNVNSRKSSRSSSSSSSSSSRRKEYKVSHVDSGIKTSVQLLPDWIVSLSTPSTRIPRLGGYQRIADGFAQNYGETNLS